jgi:hypothetical protein
MESPVILILIETKSYQGFSKRRKKQKELIIKGTDTCLNMSFAYSLDRRDL